MIKGSNHSLHLPHWLQCDWSSPVHAGTNQGISLAGPISGTEAESESLRLLRPTLLSLAGYFNTSSVSEEAVQVLQVGSHTHRYSPLSLFGNPL